MVADSQRGTPRTSVGYRRTSAAGGSFCPAFSDLVLSTKGRGRVLAIHLFEAVTWCLLVMFLLLLGIRTLQVPLSGGEETP